ncbi:MAG: GLUG motif-containing protein [Dehalococcoidia bacterium]
MERILRLRKYHCVKRVGIFLITAALIAGMLGCAAEIEPTPPAHYDLTISSTPGGSVTIPGEETSTHDPSTVVDLLAEAEEGYQFTKWTGNVGTIANVDAASTTVTMNGNYLITANFAKEIRDWHDLNAVRDDVAGSYVLMNGLDSSTHGYLEFASEMANDGKGWEPIGTGHVYLHVPYTRLDPFTGTFNGQGYEIRDLFIDRPDENGVGLFGFLEARGLVEDLRLVDADVTAEGYVGGLVGWNAGGTVSNSYSSGSVAGGWGVGGLTGANKGTVSNSHSSSSVRGGWGVGGLTGDSFGGALRNSYFTGSVTGDEVGGLVGWNAPGTVSNSHYNYHEVLLNGENIITIGALFDEDFEEWLANDRFLDVNERLSEESGYYVIENVSDFKQLLAFGQDSSFRFRLTNDLDLATEPNFYIPYLTGEFDGAGHKVSNLSFIFDFVSQVGLFGYVGSDGKVTQVAHEDVTIAGNRFVGGLVGANHGGTVSNSYATGSVCGGAWYIGGLVGDNRGTVSNCYSSSSVTGERWVGGLVGSILFGAVSNSFWDVEASGMERSAGGVGKTTAEMNDIATFLAAGWDIIAVASGETNTAYVWNIVDGQTYPFLSWQPIS